jgi:ABC-2 type transport system ATP-binding protein
MDVISVSQLTKRFGDFTAVNEISFDVQAGEIFGFLGANGAGKTTAMRMLCGLLVPTSGTARVAGYDIARETEAVKRNIGYMSQKFSLYDTLTVRENLRFYGGIYGLSHRELDTKITALTERLGLAAEKNALVGSLPLGWKQKIAFSAAMLHRPKVVFLDEPTGGVDPITRRTFWDMIYEAADEGITVFVTTHYMDEAEYCHRVCIMVDGAVADLSTPAEMKLRHGADNMDEVFYRIARRAVRGDGA